MKLVFISVNKFLVASEVMQWPGTQLQDFFSDEIMYVPGWLKRSRPKQILALCSMSYFVPCCFSCKEVWEKGNPRHKVRHWKVRFLCEDVSPSTTLLILRLEVIKKFNRFYQRRWCMDDLVICWGRGMVHEWLCELFCSLRNASLCVCDFPFLQLLSRMRVR